MRKRFLIDESLQHIVHGCNLFNRFAHISTLH
jgi:hypothetical protein